MLILKENNMEINNRFITATQIMSDLHFNFDGCENCANGLGCSVHTVVASSQNLVTGKWTNYPIILCHECIMANNYSEPLPKKCKNIYNI